MRLLNNKAFQPGPFYLGRAGIFIGWIAVAWITTITVHFHPLSCSSLHASEHLMAGRRLLHVAATRTTTLACTPCQLLC